jgi:hypothetical protein
VSTGSASNHRKKVEQLAENLANAWSEGYGVVGHLSEGEISEDELRSTAMETMEMVGEGSAGSVYKVQHKLTGLVMAKKVNFSFFSI